jgi:hypothetical protein
VRSVVACERTVLKSTLDAAHHYDNMVVDTLQCVLDELRQHHTIPADAVITFRVEFEEES